MDDGAAMIRTKGVIHERLDDEVIAIDLDRGIYYSMIGPAADIWTSLQLPVTVESVAEALAKRYDAQVDEIGGDVVEFVRTLRDVGLVLIGPADDATEPPALTEPLTGAWERPELEAYSDMADLVLLDPIHQVDEAGWPHRPEHEP